MVVIFFRSYKSKDFFYPIAKDREQAFCFNQGFLPGIIKGQALVPQLEGFKAKSKDIRRFYNKPLQ